jgi:predicted DNA-binding protein (MmcQ/YjbR family)
VLDDAEGLHPCVWKAALQQPGATQTRPFGPGFEVFKVAGKVFAMTTTVQGEAIVTLKCEPDTGEALRQEYPTVRAGYHMNKKHWISIGPGPGITEQLLVELVSNAYLLVLDGLAGRVRAQIAADAGTTKEFDPPHLSSECR